MAVAPLIPNGTADDSAGGLVAKIVAGTDLAGTFLKGFAAMSQATYQRQQVELEAQKLAQSFELQTDSHAIQREQLAAQLPVHKAHEQYYLSRARAETAEAYDGLMGRAAYNRQLAELEATARKREADLKLNDPKFETENPIEFAANALEFNRTYKYAASNYIKARTGELQRKIDQQKMTVREGGTYEADKGWVGGRAYQEPIWRVVEGVQNPETRERYTEMLKQGGHIKDETYEVPGKPESLPAWQQFINKHTMRDTPPYKPKSKTATRQKPDDTIKPWFEGGKTYDFNRGQNEVPSELMAPYRKGVGVSRGQQDNVDQATLRMQQEVGDLPAPDLPVSEEPTASSAPVGTPTETDKMIQHARAAVAHGAPIQAVAERLQSMSIDPSVLFTD